jgi:GntR family transcriptional regulator/MocR family aminotransferase
MIAPASLRGALRTAKQLTDRHGEISTHPALARFIDDGLLARHIRKVTREYATRHALIAEASRRDFSEWVRLIPSAAGINVAVDRAPDVSI